MYKLPYHPLAAFVLKWIIALLFIAAIAGPILLVAWFIWCAVFTYFWPAGPAQIIHPNFWPFAGAFVLFRWFFGTIRK